MAASIFSKEDWQDDGQISTCTGQVAMPLHLCLQGENYNIWKYIFSMVHNVGDYVSCLQICKALYSILTQLVDEEFYWKSLHGDLDFVGTSSHCKWAKLCHNIMKVKYYQKCPEGGCPFTRVLSIVDFWQFLQSVAESTDHEWVCESWVMAKCKDRWRSIKFVATWQEDTLGVLDEILVANTAEYLRHAFIIAVCRQKSGNKEVYPVLDKVDLDTTWEINPLPVNLLGKSASPLYAYKHLPLLWLWKHARRPYWIAS